MSKLKTKNKMAKKSKYYVRPDGLHEAIRTIGGKRVAFRGKTDAEVERKMIEYRENKAKGKLFSDVVQEWRELHDKAVSFSTVRAYSAPIKSITAHCEGLYAKNITAKDIKAHLNELSAQGYSIKTIKKYYTIYRSSLQYAAEQGYVDNNVAVNVTMPQFAKKSVVRDPATEEEEKLIRDNVHLWLLPYFLLMTGLRKGEALALTYADIDKKNKVIHITKSLAYKYNTPYIKEPKTAAGVRDVPLLDELAPHIPDGKPNEFIFSPDGENRPMSMMVFQRKWANFQKATGITCTAHQLRHSFATMLYDADVDVKQAQDILGHTTEAMTRDVYTKISERKRKSAADNLNAFIKSKHSSDTGQAKIT